VVVASEPLDDGPGWHEVAPDTLVRVDARGGRVESLAMEGAEHMPRHRKSG